MNRRKITVSAALTMLGLGHLPLTTARPEANPRDVLERFCELDAQGKRFSPEGRQELAPLFSEPVKEHFDQLIVVRDFVVSKPAIDNRRVEFYVEYITLGRIDPSLARFSRLPSIKVRSGFSAVMTNTGWQIEGAPPEPHVSPETALRYVIELRNAAKDESTKKSAERTIKILNGLIVRR